MNSYESAQAILHILDLIVRLGAVVGIAFWVRKKVLTAWEHSKAPKTNKYTSKIPQKREFVKGVDGWN